LNVLLAFFSWTGNTRIVAEEIVRCLSPHHKIDVCMIEPRRRRKHLEWLLLSLTPSSKVEILPAIYDASGYDLIILGAPKWSLSCPPMNCYLSRLKGGGKKLAAIFITYGGFDEKRYLNKLVELVEFKGARVKATLLARRKEIRRGEYREWVRMFCERLECANGNTTAV
jgi:flavodoxin